MQTHLRIVIVVCSMIFLLSHTNSFAQPGAKNKPSKREKIEAQRVAFITGRLELTPAEAQVFWPIYNEFDAKRHEIMKLYHGAPDTPEKPIEELSDKEATEIADNQLVEAQKMLDLRKEYHSKFKSVLPPKKVMLLYDSERDFQRELIDRLRGGKRPGDRTGSGPGKGRQNRDIMRGQAPE